MRRWVGISYDREKSFGPRGQRFFGGLIPMNGDTLRAKQVKNQSAKRKGVESLRDGV